MFFVSARRGENKSSAIEIINHQDEPLEITGVSNPSTRFTTSLETLAPGQRYRLTLRLRADGIAGKRSEAITLRTSSARFPQFRIAANTLVRERVYTAPEEVEFGRIPAAAFTPGSPLGRMLSQTLMVYQAPGGSSGTQDFQLTASSDQPYVSISAERAANGSQYQLTIRLLPEKITGRSAQGSIRLATNDAEFPTLDVPFSADLEAAPGGAAANPR